MDFYNNVLKLFWTSLLFLIKNSRNMGPLDDKCVIFDQKFTIWDRWMTGHNFKGFLDKERAEKESYITYL